ncbi:MAG TPA: ABC transporter substrate-binding protein [Alphaproteobacteria bacterium]|nr:ABC transporter substrate-binding protein [Alphaproteobacteria bacterium]
MKRSGKMLVLLAVLFAGGAMAGAAARADEVPGVSKDEIRIGSFGAMTGPQYLYGKLTMNGVDAVFHKVNAAGGINGRKLTLVREDDRCDPATAIAAVKKLVFEEKVFVLIGGGCSNATLAARPEIEKDEIPFNCFASVADGISDPVSKYIYTTMLTASIESRSQVQYAVDHGAKKIAVVSQHDAWGQSRYVPLMADLKRRNIEPALDLEMTVDDNDATTQALKITQAGADAVIMVVYPKPGAVLTRALYKLGQRPILIGQTGIADPVAFTKDVDIPGATDKFVTPAAVRFAPSDPQVKEWTTLIKQLFPNDELSVFNLMGIGAAEVMVAALKEAGPDLTREKFLAAMAHIKVDTDTYASTVLCNDPTSHQCNNSPAWMKAAGDHAEMVGVTTVH